MVKYSTRGVYMAKRSKYHFVSSYLNKYDEVEIADYILEREFPGKYVNALGELVLEDDEVED